MATHYAQTGTSGNMDPTHPDYHPADGEIAQVAEDMVPVMTSRGWMVYHRYDGSGLCEMIWNRLQAQQQRQGDPSRSELLRKHGYLGEEDLRYVRNLRKWAAEQFRDQPITSRIKYATQLVNFVLGGSEPAETPDPPSR